MLPGAEAQLFSIINLDTAAILAGADACAAAAAFGIQGLVGVFGRNGQGAAAIGDSAAGILGHVLLDAGVADASLDRVVAFDFDLHVTVACDIHTGCAAAAAARSLFLPHGNIVEGQLEFSSRCC